MDSKRRRRIYFRIGAILFPFLLILVIELGLRLCRVGYSTSFFLHEQVNGREMLVDNPRFGWRFFPPAIARTPEPAMFAAKKEPGAYRVFVFGESAAMGDPEPGVGLPRMLQAMLETAMPGRKVEVINVAMTAINSHVIREIARECATLDADAWVVYAGNNEVVGPFGGGTVFGPQVPPLGLIRLSLWLKTTRVGQLLNRSRGTGPAEWGGMEMFLKQQVSANDARLAKVYANFGANLRDVLRLGRHSGADVVVSTVAVNLRDSPPFTSAFDSPLQPNSMAQWTIHYSNAIISLQASNWSKASAELMQASMAVGSSTYAEWHFHAGVCALASNGHLQAIHEFKAARDLDTLRFRADTGINDMIRAATSSTGAQLIDAENQIQTAIENAGAVSPIPGGETFYEHVHFNFDGNYALATLFAKALLQKSGVKAGALPTRDECARRLGWNEWKQRGVCTEVRKRLQQPPFTAQYGHARRDAEWEQRINKLAGDLNRERLRQIATDYATLINQHPSDWVLREDAATLLEETGEHSAALEQWREVSKLLPHDPLPHFHMGNMLDTLGRPNESIPHFREALRQDPRMVEARNSLALALAAIGDRQAAQREFELAIKERPRFAQARINLGQLLAGSGDTAAARKQYEAALMIDSNSAAAHVNLGKLLSADGDKTGAIAHYERALRSNPNSAIAHFNFANALVATNPTRAIQHYRAAVLADPSFAEARYALAMEMARQGNAPEALEQFAETLKLRPEMAEAHFNYGVALAKSARYSDAAREFRETLRLKPDDAKAREFLDRAIALDRK